MKVPVLPIILVLMSWLSFSDPQMPRMNLATPRVGEAINFANHLMRLEDRGPSIRKECRMLTSRELERIFDALQRAKRDTRLQPNVLDSFAFLHSHPDVNAGAHGGTAFLPFHRVYLYLYEKLLRMYEPSLSLCYWDSTLEPEDHERSETWGANLFGTPRGLITTGFAANWLTPLGPLIREVAPGERTRGARTLREDDIENVLSKNTIGEISFPNGRLAENVEELHNHVHLYVGGLMGQIESAAYDPIFWFHHTFVDCLYERFRKKQNTTQGPKIDPQRDWPQDFGDEANAPFGPMRLGALRNIDGESNFFSEYMTCEPLPECRRDRDCGRFMNCNTRQRRCVSNTRPPAQQAGSMFGGMFSMGQNSFNGMFQNGRFSTQGNRGFNQMNNGPMGFPSFLNQNQGPGNFPGMGFTGQNQQNQRPQGFFQGMGGQQGNQQGFPQMPGMGGPQMPGMGGPQMPGMGGPQMPGMGGQQMPGMGGQQMPGMGGQQMPGMGGLQMPGMGGQQMPGMGGPQMPGMGGQQMPGLGGPQMPGMGGPQMPGMGGAQMPGMGGPQMPGMGGPQMPGMGGPQMPNFGGQGQSQMPRFPGLGNFGGRGQTPNQGMPNFG